MKVAAVLLAAYSAVVITVVVQKRLDDISSGPVTHAAAQPGSRVQCFGAAAVYAKATCIPLTDTTLVPSPVDAGEDNKIWWSECFINVDEPVMPTCHDGATDGTVRIALFGDSHAGMFRNALMATAKARGWQVDTYYGAGCRVGVPWRCPSLDSTLEKLANGKYNLILTTGFYDAALSNIDGGRGMNPGDDVAVSDAWKKLIAASGSKLVVIGDVPRITEDALACIKLVSTTADTDCSMERGPAVTRVTLDSAVGRTPEAGFIDLTNIFCDAQRCQPIIGSAIVYADGASHLTDTFAESLGPYLADKIATFLPSP
ncbi:MAG: hypothetical protein LLG14_11720 [Nocardiaceae bacterium]|nr:hypothetical protein [Nocardiaceae bacterium]